MMERLHHRLLRGMLDILLLLPALAVVLSEHVLWAGSRALLRGVVGLPAVRAAHVWLGLLPPYAALPVFLVPDVFSHASEIWAGVLAAEGHFVSATVLLAFGKGLATLVLVWIYQACEPALLRVRWFARMHHAVTQARIWLLARLRPHWTRLRDRAIAVVPKGGQVGGQVGLRFRHWRRRLGARVKGVIRT